MEPELPLEQELEAMNKLVAILKPFPKGQRDRLTNWALTRTNSLAQRGKINGRIHQEFNKGT
jgi:hypothetical protein